MDHKLLYKKRLIFTTDSANILSSAYGATLEIIQLHPWPTAIFAANDENAISAIVALQDHGIRVPQDIASVSIDNIANSEMIRPDLTTVDVPKKQMASYEMQILLIQEQVKGQQAASIVLPNELIIRESCGVKKSSPQ